MFFTEAMKNGMHFILNYMCIYRKCSNFKQLQVLLKKLSMQCCCWASRGCLFFSIAGFSGACTAMYYPACTAVTQATAGAWDGVPALTRTFRMPVQNSRAEPRCYKRR